MEPGILTPDTSKEVALVEHRLVPRKAEDILDARLRMLEETQRATLNILEDFDEERHKYQDIQKATMNLLEDMNEERQKYQDMQKATMNLLEDMNEERERYQAILKASLNLLEDMDEERRKADEVKTALMNMLEDIEVERVSAERARLQLESVNRELEAFSYSVSHDLRAPLRALSGFAEAVIMDYTDLLDEKGKRYLNFIRDNAHIMGQLIDDLLAFSRIGRQAMAAVAIDLAELAREVFVELMITVSGRRIEFTAHPVPPARADRALIRQVLINLISNAIKFSRPRETARIEFGYAPDMAAYFVKDNGVGFDMAYADTLFGVFQRLHATTEFEGTGVGLALVNRIITRHNGRVWADARENEGATFYFTLPREE